MSKFFHLYSFRVSEKFFSLYNENDFERELRKIIRNEFKGQSKDRNFEISLLSRHNLCMPILNGKYYVRADRVYVDLSTNVHVYFKIVLYGVLAFIMLSWISIGWIRLNSLSVYKTNFKLLSQISIGLPIMGFILFKLMYEADRRLSTQKLAMLLKLVKTNHDNELK